MKKNNQIMNTIKRKQITSNCSKTNVINNYKRRKKAAKPYAKMKRKANYDIDDLSEEEMEIYEALKDEIDEDTLLKRLCDGDYYCYYNCNDYSDVAYQIVEEEGIDMFNKDVIRDCIDYDQLGNMLSYDGMWFEVGNNMVQFY